MQERRDLNEKQPNLESLINIVIVDDHALIRQGIRKLLEEESDLVVVAEAGNGRLALELAHDVQPDVFLLDLNLPDMNGLQVTSQIKAQHSHIAVILMTAYDAEEQIIHAMRAGVNAYCPKEIQADLLINIIRQVSKGNYVINGRIYNERGVQDWLTDKMESLIGTYMADDGEHYGPLSPREMEILRCVTRGMSNKQIALELGISQQTVKNHMTSILDKLNVADRTQAAVYALKRGWVRMGDKFTPAAEDE